MMRNILPVLYLTLFVVGCAALTVHPPRTTDRPGTAPDFTQAHHANTANGWRQFMEDLPHEY